MSLVAERVQRELENTRDCRHIKHLEEENARMRATLETFRKITGVDLAHGWQGPKRIAAAVDAVLHLDHHRNTLQNIVEGLQRSLDAWPTVEGAGDDRAAKPAGAHLEVGSSVS